MEMKFLKDEDGFTTAGSAIALLLVFALIFAALHAYWVGSHSGEVQYVADAGALAADSVVADFVTIGQVVDAALLSFSLTILIIFAVSAVAAFIPGAQSVASSLANLGSQVMRARDSFYQSAQKGLDAAQKALPVLCAARASECIEANAQASGIDYSGTALALPLEGLSVELADGKELENAADTITSKEADIQEAASKYQAAQEKMEDAKQESWLADCGGEPMSMYQRANSLAGLSGGSNPYYSSAELWSYQVGLNRAIAYYQARYQQEAGASASGSPELVGESVARKKFYEYASETVSQGVISTENGLEIPHLSYLARNTDQIKETSLYTDASYPVSISNGVKTLHAYSGCPNYQAGSAAGYAAVSSIDSGECHECELCKFSAQTLGRVPSASTSIDNGFEYYYKCFVDNASAYKEAAEQASALKAQLDQERDSISSTLSEAASSALSKRYDPQPPGRYGCICIVEAPASLSGVSSSFFKGASEDGTRLALSGATLAADTDVESSDVISSVGSNLFPDDSLSSGLSKTVFGIWSELLCVYAKGTEGIDGAFKKAQGSIGVEGTALSGQAAGAFNKALSSIGLEPADLYAYKPVLVNTSYILERDGGSAAKIILKIKEGAQDLSAASEQLASIAAQLEDLTWTESGILIANLALQELGLGTGDTQLSLPANMESLQSLGG